MDTQHDWTEDGYEMQLVSLATPLVPEETQVVTRQAQVVPVNHQLVPIDTQSVSVGTELSPVEHEPEAQLASPDRSPHQESALSDITQSEPASNSSDEQIVSSRVPASSNQLKTELDSSGFETVPLRNSQDGHSAEEVSQAFLDYFLTYPIIKNMRAADLLNQQELLEAARIWRQMGGKLEHVLVDRMGIKSTTIKFFSNDEAGQSAKKQGCKRIGEFLRAAGLVSEGEIQFVLEELKQHGRTLKLGDALVEQGLIKQSTIDYFANRFINPNAVLGSINPKENDSGSENFFDDDSHFRLDEFILVVGNYGQFSSHTLRTRMYSIGRGVGNDIVVNDKFVSRRHAYLIRTQDSVTNATTYEVLDCGKTSKYSTNGIFVNGKKVKHQALKAGDVIHIGPKIHARFLAIE